MATTRRDEKRLLPHEEYAFLETTHYPALQSVAAEELRALAARLREQHARARDVLRAGRRARSGKGSAGAASNAEAGRLTERKQLYAAALKRVNARFAAVSDERLRAERTAKLREALERRRATPLTRPAAGVTAGEGMRAKGSSRGHRGVNPGRIGSVSAQGKAAQARRDG
jgi:hypothetical protein